MADVEGVGDVDIVVQADLPRRDFLAIDIEFERPVVAIDDHRHVDPLAGRHHAARAGDVLASGGIAHRRPDLAAAVDRQAIGRGVAQPLRHHGHPAAGEAVEEEPALDGQIAGQVDVGPVGQFDIIDPAQLQRVAVDPGNDRRRIRVRPFERDRHRRGLRHVIHRHAIIDRPVHDRRAHLHHQRIGAAIGEHAGVDVADLHRTGNLPSEGVEQAEAGAAQRSAELLQVDEQPVPGRRVDPPHGIVARPAGPPRRDATLRQDGRGCDVDQAKGIGTGGRAGAVDGHGIGPRPDLDQRIAAAIFVAFAVAHVARRRNAARSGDGDGHLAVVVQRIEQQHLRFGDGEAVGARIARRRQPPLDHPVQSRQVAQDGNIRSRHLVADRAARDRVEIHPQHEPAGVRRRPVHPGENIFRRPTMVPDAQFVDSAFQLLIAVVLFGAGADIERRGGAAVMRRGGDIGARRDQHAVQIDAHLPRAALDHRGDVRPLSLRHRSARRLQRVVGRPAIARQVDIAAAVVPQRIAAPVGPFALVDQRRPAVGHPLGIQPELDRQILAQVERGIVDQYLLVRRHRQRIADLAGAQQRRLLDIAVERDRRRGGRRPVQRKAIIARRRVPHPPLDHHDIGACLIGGEFIVRDTGRGARLRSVGPDDPYGRIADAQ